MKQKLITCRGCKKEFNIFVNKRIKSFTLLSGLPNCNHHKKQPKGKDK